MLAAAATTRTTGFNIAAPVKTSGSTGTGTKTVALPRNPSRTITGTPTDPISAGLTERNRWAAIGAMQATTMTATVTSVEVGGVLQCLAATLPPVIDSCMVDPPSIWCKA
jgi:hypothetical protein